MLKTILFKFWPVLIPILIYLIWHFFFLKEDGDNRKKKQAKGHFYLLLGIFLSFIISILLIFIFESKDKTRFYEPAKIQDGEIVPYKVK